LFYKHKWALVPLASKKRSGWLRDLAEGLVKVGALQFGTFSLPDGRDSSYYINLRSLPSYPGVFGLVTGALTDLAKAKAARADAFCAVPPTGLALASPIAVALRRPLVYTRAAKKSGEKMIVGEVMPDWDVVVLDDLAGSGKTILAAAEAVEEEGGVVKKAVVLIDRLEGAREKLRRKGIVLHSATDVVELAHTLVSMELLSEDQLEAITKSVGRQ
jgi:orotate phosphoribosyltransferase